MTDTYTHIEWGYAADMVSTYALNEQNMNSVERLLVYSELPPEGDETTANDPPPSWPEKGTIAFKNISLAYREDLPLVLKGVSFSVHAGEKVRQIIQFKTLILNCIVDRRRWENRSRYVIRCQSNR